MRLAAVESLDLDREAIAGPGPVYHGKHSVQYSGHDKASFVRMDELDAPGKIRLYRNLR
jgi:hypothetical protein